MSKSLEGNWDDHGANGTSIRMFQDSNGSLTCSSADASAVGWIDAKGDWGMGTTATDWKGELTFDYPNGTTGSFNFHVDRDLDVIIFDNGSKWTRQAAQS